MDMPLNVATQMTKSILEGLAPFLPNRWMCHRLVKWSGAAAFTTETLGNGMKAEVFFGDIIGCHIHYSGWYEAHVVKALLPLLCPDTVFVDVGANIGQYTMLAAPLVHQVVAFEPNPTTFACLARNVERNKLSNVRLFPMAASSTIGSATIFDSDPTNRGAASLRAEGDGPRVKTCTLDSVLDDSTGGGKLFLKVDVEGAELDVLHGAIRVLLQHKPTILIEVLEENQNRFGRTAQQVLEVLRACGYTFLSVADKGLTHYDAQYVNVLAVPAPFSNEPTHGGKVTGVPKAVAQGPTNT